LTKTVNDTTSRLLAGVPVSTSPGAEPKEQTAEERWNSAGIGNAVIFGKVMSANPDLLLELLQISLPEMEIVEILDPRQEEYLKSSYDARGVRLDITVRDVSGRVFNVEMQLQDEKNIPKRMRYYSSTLDQTILKPGEDYSKLGDTVVMFITPFDPFGLGNYRYTFRNICIENNELELCDGSSKIVLNATGNTGAISPELKGFLDLVIGINKNKDPEENEEKRGMTYADRVQEKVRIAKLNSGLRREFMNWEMTLLVERNKGHDEGHAEGLAEGRAEGLAEGLAEGRAEGLTDGEILKLVKLVRKKLSLHQSEEKIADDLVEDISLVHTICELIKQMPDENDEGVLQEYKQNLR
jgi:predicted transposase/invertase (TIGR01784 family)